MSEESDLQLPTSPEDAATLAWKWRGSSWGIFTTVELAWHWKQLYLLCHHEPTIQKAADRAGTWFINEGINAIVAGLAAGFLVPILLDAVSLVRSTANEFIDAGRRWINPHWALLPKGGRESSASIGWPCTSLVCVREVTGWPHADRVVWHRSHRRGRGPGLGNRAQWKPC